MGYGYSNVDSIEYEKLDKLALEFLQDYEIYLFPIDVFYIAEKNLHAELVKYSQLTNEQKGSLFNKLTKKENTDLTRGFTVFENMSDGSIHYIIYYNDELNSNAQRYTIAHEIKHILCNEDNPTRKQEDLAEYFAKIFIAPKAVALNENIIEPIEIENYFDLTERASENLSSALNNRILARGEDFLEEFEKEYLTNRDEYLKDKGVM